MVGWAPIGRQKARLGAPKAITATAHKMARIIYNMLKYRREFVDVGADHYEAQYRKRQTQGLMTKATSLGFRLVPVDTPEPVVAEA